MRLLDVERWDRLLDPKESKEWADWSSQFSVEVAGSPHFLEVYNDHREKGYLLNEETRLSIEAAVRAKGPAVKTYTLQW
jgi:hypothetical protein